MLKNLKIKNFKCFDDISIDFGKLTVFAGENAAGKSSVIQSLLLLSQCKDNFVDPNYKNADIKYLSQGLKYSSCNIKLNDEYLMHLGSFKEVLSSKSENSSILLEVEYQKENDRMKKKFELIGNNNNSICFSEYNSNEPFELFNSSIKYLYAERIGPRLTQNLSSSISPHTGYQGEYTNHVLLENFDNILVEGLLIQNYYNTEVKELFLGKQVQHWLDFITPGVELYPQGHANIYSTSMGIRRSGFTSNFLNPYNIGFGITYVLPIIVNCLISHPGDCVIIENPEAHLHPKGQSNLGQFLAQVASVGVQVILETHSDHIIDGIRRAIVNNIISENDAVINFHEVYNEDGKSSINIRKLIIDEKGEFDFWPIGFMNQKLIDMEAIFKSRLEKE